MAHPGPRSGENYFHPPYNPDWMPIDSRQWAMKYLAEDGTENYLGFAEEFRKRHPFLTAAGQSTTYLPPTVDQYLRTDEKGVRQDYDQELAAIPLNEEEIETQKRVIAEENKRKREMVLASRGLDTNRKPLKPAKGKQTPEQASVRAAEAIAGV